MEKEKRWRNRHKMEDGSVTIEATISLTAFMFVIVTLLTVVNIAIAQAKISYALNTTAREISQYSYLYSLTGFNNSQKKIYDAGVAQTKPVSDSLNDIFDAYHEIEKLGGSGDGSFNNVDDITKAWDGVKTTLDNVKGSVTSMGNNMEEIVKDPKSVILGLARLAGSKGYDMAKTKLIAVPLAKAMCKRHLSNEKGGNVEEYLKWLHVYPEGGSYFDGLDFGESKLFPNGSNLIELNVKYKIKVLPLLPLDFKFEFKQSAITRGWSAGDQDYKEQFKEAEKMQENHTFWTDTPVNERVSFMRRLTIKEMSKEGYDKTTGLTDVQLYNPEKNEFAMIASMNPLWSKDGEPPRTLADIDDTALRDHLARLAGKMKSTTDGLNTITTRHEKDGISKKQDQSCKGASNRIILVIPEDPGLKEKIEGMIKEMGEQGVEFDVRPGFGNGARVSPASPKGGN